jgi:hypothetical protein
MLYIELAFLLYVSIDALCGSGPSARRKGIGGERGAHDPYHERISCSYSSTLIVLRTLWGSNEGSYVHYNGVLSRYPSGRWRSSNTAVKL